jgi:hypothetical protein
MGSSTTFSSLHNKSLDLRRIGKILRGKILEFSAGIPFETQTRSSYTLLLTRPGSKRSAPEEAVLPTGSEDEKLLALGANGRPRLEFFEGGS